METHQPRRFVVIATIMAMVFFVLMIPFNVIYMALILAAAAFVLLFGKGHGLHHGQVVICDRPVDMGSDVHCQ